MGKELSEMTLEELWALFPIILKEHNDEYTNWYEEEKKQLIRMFGKEKISRINHVGSTAVKGLIAKPTVDILMEISRDCDLEEIQSILTTNGWILMNTRNNPVFSQTYNKGYTKEGFAEKVYHLHVRYLDDWDELYFRDYLIDNKEIAEEYAKLKIELMTKYKHNRDAYTDGKTNFVKCYSLKAKEKYLNRYSISL